MRFLTKASDHAMFWRAPLLFGPHPPVSCGSVAEITTLLYLDFLDSFFWIFADLARIIGYGTVFYRVADPDPHYREAKSGSALEWKDRFDSAWKSKCRELL
jgi:hypothetical protein